MVDEELSCDQADCPIATEGRCLEGFPSGEGCPHLATADQTAAPSDSEVEDDADDVVAEEDLDEVDPLRELGGIDQLDLREANQVARAYGARLVLIAGEYESGKTTLIVELYAQFLRGPVADWLFAGSRTLMVLDRRHLPTRFSSGRSHPDTERTQPEHEGLLHLRVWQQGKSVPLFLTDLRGERFEHVGDGVPVESEIPFAARADLVVVLVDGEKLAVTTSRQATVRRARQLIGGLTEPAGVRPGTRMLIAVTKADVLTPEVEAWLGGQVDALVAFAQQRKMEARHMRIASRPAAEPDAPRGLVDLFGWMVEPLDEPAVPEESASRVGDREFWKFSA